MIEDNQEINDNSNRRKWRWLRWTSLLAVASGVTAAGIAARRISRPRDLRWLDHAHILHHARSSNFRVVNGVRIHYQEMGDRNGKPMILIHGYCSSNYSWKDCMASFANAGYRVLAVDLKGYGFSEKPADGQYGVLDQANLILSLMDSLKLESATLVGSSYGGAISMACALKQPSRVERLILVGAAHNNKAIHRAPKYSSRLLTTAGLAGILGPLLFGSPRVVRFYLSRMYHDQSVFTQDRFDSYHRPLRTATCQAAAISTFRQWQLDWIEKEMDSIQVPTLIIWGEFDWALPVEWGAEIHMAIPNSKFIVIPDCGHLPQEERPADTCALILDFCAREQQPAQANVRQIKR